MGEEYGMPVLVHPELNHTATFQFSDPIIAWGADIGRGHTRGLTKFPRIDFYDVNDVLLGTVPISDTYIDDEIQFYGVTLTGGAASRVVFDNSSEFNAVFGLDNIQFVAVPEPSSAIATSTCTLAAFAFLRRRLRRPQG